MNAVLLNVNASSSRLRIACAVDLTDNDRATFASALHIARMNDADLLLVHALPRSTSFSKDALAAIRACARLREDARALGVSVTVRIEKGRPARAIARYATSREAQIIVLGKGARTGWTRVRTVAEQVARRVSVPVLVVPKAHQSHISLPNHVLCAVDFTPAAYAACAEAFRLASAHNSPLTVCHVVRRRDYLKSFGALLRRRGPASPDVLIAAAKQRLHATLLGMEFTGTRLTARLAIGAPHSEIMRIASEVGATLMVVGVSRRRRGASLQPTASRVIRDTGVPVLVVQPQMAAVAKCETGPRRLAA